MVLDELHNAGSDFIESFDSRYSTRVLATLLCDCTTGRNIIWADNEYEILEYSYMGDDAYRTACAENTLPIGSEEMNYLDFLEKMSQAHVGHDQGSLYQALISRMLVDLWYRNCGRKAIG